MFLLQILLFVLATEAQKLGRGSCPKTFVVQKFDVQRYLGKWYEIFKYPNIFQNGKCTEANYGPIDLEGNVEVLNKEWNSNEVTAVRGVAAQDKTQDGGLQVTLKVPIVGEQTSDYNVLGTDYENWAVVHACRPILQEFVKIEFAWVLARQRKLQPEHMAEAIRTLDNNGIDRHALKMTSQDGCPKLDSLPYQLIA